MLSLLFVSLLVPYDNPNLLGNEGAAANANLVGFDSFMNVVILVSVISIGNAGVYGGSRTLTALAEQGYAPKIFAYIDRSGRPLFSTIAIIVCGLLAYMNLAATGETIFDWLLALSGLAALFTWGSICIAHIRFRAAWKHHGHTVDEIPFQAVFGVYGSWIGLLMIFLVLVAQVRSPLPVSLLFLLTSIQFYVAIWPLGGGVNSAEGFFQVMLALPVVLVFWIVGYVWKGRHMGLLTLDKIDVDAGRREVDWEGINGYKAHIASKPL